MSAIKESLPSVDVVKTTLKEYSKFMRRDFLAILVKMSAKYFNIRTVRCDWRTRTGMVSFLQGVWEKFAPLLSEDSIFNWYCTNFDSLEKLFSERKFMMYVFAKWNDLEEFLKQDETIIFMKQNENELIVLLSNPKSSHSSAFDQPIGQKFIEIIDEFCNTKQSLSSTSTMGPRVSMPKSSSMPTMSQIQKQIQQLHQQQKTQQLLLKQKTFSMVQPTAQPNPVTITTTTNNQITFTPMFSESKCLSADVSDTETSTESEFVTEELFDPVNFEIGEYNPEAFPVVSPMDYPYSIDLYSL